MHFELEELKALFSSPAEIVPNPILSDHNARSGLREHRWKKAKPKRFRRRGRLSQTGWYTDWFKALRIDGWQVATPGILPAALRLTLKQLGSVPFVRFRRGFRTLNLHLATRTVGTPLEESEAPFPRLWAADAPTEYNIVRGRQADSSRGICRQKGHNTATKICKLCSPPVSAPYFVEFDGRLYEGKVGISALGVTPADRYDLFYSDAKQPWTECRDGYLNTVYEQYRVASPHHSSIRAYSTKRPILA